MQGSLLPFYTDFLAMISICPNITTVDLSCVVTTSPLLLTRPDAVQLAKSILQACGKLEKLRCLKLPHEDHTYVDALLLHGAELMPATRKIRELHVKGSHHNLSFLLHMTNLETLEISGECVSGSKLHPLQQLDSLRKLVILNESEPLAEVDVIRLFSVPPSVNGRPPEKNALNHLKSLTISSVWMHYQNLALLFRCCGDLEELSISIYLQSLDLLAADPFLHLPTRLEKFVLNMPKTVGDNRALVNFVWRRFLDAVEDHPRIKEVSMFQECLKTTWGRARECKLITQQSRYDERGRGLLPTILHAPIATGKIDKTLFRDINVSVKTLQDWNNLKKMLRLVPHVRTLSIIWHSEEEDGAPLFPPTRHKIATRIDKLFLEMTTLTKDLVGIVDAFVNVDCLKIAGFIYEPPLQSPGHKTATRKDVDEMMRLPVIKTLGDFEVELTRMCYYEPKKTDFRFIEDELQGLIADEKKTKDMTTVGGNYREEPGFDFTAWTNLSTLKLFYRSAIDPKELQAILHGAVNLKAIHLACVHDDKTDLSRAVALDLLHLKNHRKLQRIYLNYHHLSRDSMRRRHVEPLTACLERFDWSVWSPDLEEIVIAFVGLRGVQTDAVIATRNAARKMVVQKDD